MSASKKQRNHPTKKSRRIAAALVNHGDTYEKLKDRILDNLMKLEHDLSVLSAEYVRHSLLTKQNCNAEILELRRKLDRLKELANFCLLDDMNFESVKKAAGKPARVLYDGSSPALNPLTDENPFQATV